MADEPKQRVPDPGDEGQVHGSYLVIVPLIFGAAVIAGAIMLWTVDQKRNKRFQVTLREEEIRADLRKVYHLLRDDKPEMAVPVLSEVDAKLARLDTNWATDYLELRVSALILRGEALLNMNEGKNADEAEAKLTQALEMMTKASGEFWAMALFVRGRARYERDNYAGAEADFGTLLERNPNNGAAYYWRAHCREKSGDLTGAAQDTERAKRLDSWPPLRDVWLDKSEEQEKAEAKKGV